MWNLFATGMKYEIWGVASSADESERYLLLV